MGCGSRSWRRKGRRMRLWVRPFPANHCITFLCIVRGTTSRSQCGRVRTCHIGHILRLLARSLIRLRRLSRGLLKWLPICSIHWGRLPNPSPDCVSGHKCLRLSGNWREDAVLIESHAVGAATIFGRLEARATNLQSPVSHIDCSVQTVDLPCVFDNNGMRLRFSGAVQEAGGHGSCNWGQVPVDMDLLEAPSTTRAAVGDDSLVGVGGEGQPCRDEVQLEMEAGARC